MFPGVCGPAERSLNEETGGVSCSERTLRERHSLQLEGTENKKQKSNFKG